MFEATTILGYRGEFDNKKFALIGGDGQVTLGNCVVKANATKIRSLYHNQVLSGFAGSTADAFSLFDMFERILESKKGICLKAWWISAKNGARISIYADWKRWWSF